MLWRTSNSIDSQLNGITYEASIFYYGGGGEAENHNAHCGKASILA